MDEKHEKAKVLFLIFSTQNRRAHHIMAKREV